MQLHAAVVELSAAKNADIKYSTVQNWYPGDAEGKGGIYNFVTKRALCHGANSKVSWTQVHSCCVVTDSPSPWLRIWCCLLQSMCCNCVVSCAPALHSNLCVAIAFFPVLLLFTKYLYLFRFFELQICLSVICLPSPDSDFCRSITPAMVCMGGSDLHV